MSLEFERSDTIRPSFKRDAVVLGIWGFWVMLITTLEFPAYLTLTGVCFVVLYGAWTWTWAWAGFVFVIMGWIYSSFSLTPAALFWAACYSIYAILKLAQFRFEIRSALQFAAVVGFACIGTELIELILLDRIIPQASAPFVLYATLLSRAFIHAFLGFLLWAPIQRWAVAA